VFSQNKTLRSAEKQRNLLANCGLIYNVGNISGFGATYFNF